MKHTKFREAKFDNKKRVFHLEYTSGLNLDCPYSALGIKSKVKSSGPDPEVGGHSFFFRLETGKVDYVPYDQPLAIAKHTDYLREQLLFEVTRDINRYIHASGISKREIARRLKTSPTQLSRLLDTTNYKKDLSRLIQIAAILNYEFKWSFRKSS